MHHSFEGQTYQNPHNTQVFISSDPNALTSSVISWLPKSKCKYIYFDSKRYMYIVLKTKIKLNKYSLASNKSVMLYFTYVTCSHVNVQSLLFIMFLHNRVSSISMADGNFSICRFHSV